MAIDTVPVGGYSDITKIVSAAAQTAILAEIDKLIALIPQQTGSSSDVPGPAPFYDGFRPEIAAALRDELDALKTAIDAAPVS